MFVLGTAGHIDHGKSSLIKAMTGIDPDRLPEEKERGMTIDLGFAWLTLPDGNEIGLVDVPGHERFVRNMVAGAGGINAAMLVIAADDGWMPQTQEHFDILALLDIKHGLVAVTKIDLVEPDWVELVMADIQTKLKGTFLESSPVLPVSSETGEGVEDVVRAITDISQKLQAVEDIGKTRLFVDRSFVLTGIGVVVTGTSRGGGFAADSDVFQFPDGERIKVRSLQSHEKKTASIGAGTRVAINLTGVDRSEIKRGHVITGFPYEDQPTFFAVWIRNLDNSTISLKEGRKVLLILGTTETEAIIRPFDDKGIAPGQGGLAVIKTTEPLAVFVPDHFILRLPTPQITVGGGQILDILDHYPRRKDLSLLTDNLMRRKKGNIEEIILTELHKRFFVPEAGLLKYSNFSSENIKTALDTLIDGEKAVRFEDAVALRTTVESILADITNELKKTHKNKSYLKGLTAEELSRRLRIANHEQFAFLLRNLESTGALGRSQQFYHLPDFTPVLGEQMKSEADRIVVNVEQAGHNYLSYDEIESRFPGSRRTVNFLRDEDRLRIIGNQFVMTGSVWNEIIIFVEEKLGGQGQLTVAEFRDRFGSSRKYALPVLEHLDRIGVTRREGDFRIKGAAYNERHIL
jgi:selenocysteine-specific elongation factor